MALIELEDVWKTYSLGEVDVHALRGVSLSVDAGEYVALVGPSGSGKSTLMNIIGCLDRPTRGRYRLAGQDVASLDRNALADIRKNRIGFVFQNFNLLQRTSALENVELPMLYQPSLSARARRKRARALLERVGLAERLDHHPGQLSGGQQQRVAIARALANEPDILMGDEPTGNLDTRTSAEVIALFEQLNREEGLTVVMVTHDQDVARHARRILVLRDGRIVTDTIDFEEAVEALHSAQSDDDPVESPQT